MTTPLFSPEQVRAMDARAIDAGTPQAALMERAAGHVARGVTGLAGRGYGLRVGVVCGKGHNGGDGLAAARRLLAAGARPVACVVGGAEALDGLPAQQRDWWLARGGRIVATPEEAAADADVVVDCLLGTGSVGEPRGAYRDAVDTIEAARDRGALVVACDQPTGVDAATGAVPGAAVPADLTVTLGAEKAGLRLWPARGRCGRIALGDIGILSGDEQPVARMLGDPDAAEVLPGPDPTAHKRSRGVVVIVAGSEGMSGAAVLAARGAYAAGAGLATVCAAESTCRTVAVAVPEALTRPLPDDASAAFEAVADQCARADALVIGPGLGRAEPVVALVRRLVREVDLPLVLDADGLNAFAGDADALGDHRSRLLTLTPHAGELARLSPVPWSERGARLADAAAAWDAVVAAKGPGTVVAAPDGRVWVNDSGGVALATGGTGDVLSGMLGALLAADAAPERVAAGVHLHGRAGEAAARCGAARSVTAGGVADAVPAAWRRLEAARLEAAEMQERR